MRPMLIQGSAIGLSVDNGGGGTLTGRSSATVQPFVDPRRWLGVLTVKVLGARIMAREDGTRPRTAAKKVASDLAPITP